MIERPLERLNYYNGQRLEASDLKLEQDYHIRVRRWLNRSLYSPGIARGLEVREEKGTRNVVISPGLALDAEGHEIILLEEAREVVPGRGRHRAGSEAEVEGLYLTIRYDEETVAEERGVCFARASGDDPGRSRPASGGPARINARTAFNWRAFLPSETSGEVVLAQVELDKDCKEVSQVDVGVRRYVGAVSTAKVRQFALEGERDIADIPGVAQSRQAVGRIYFHIRGRQPNAVTLYLRADLFSTLHYTEMGEHKHVLDVTAGIETSQPTLTASTATYEHDHTLNQIQTQDQEAATEHSHGVWVWTEEITRDPQKPWQQVQIELDWSDQVGVHLGEFRDLREAVNAEVRDGRHRHTISAGVTTNKRSISYPHKHTLDPKASMRTAGVTDPSPPAYTARAGSPLTYVDDLQVSLGREQNPQSARNYTDDILEQLADANATDWPAGTRLGNGASNHALVLKGTGAIRLDFLPDASFTEGGYFIELRAPRKLNNEPNGGRVLYNLYIE
jgi:hypothetical protein